MDHPTHQDHQYFDFLRNGASPPTGRLVSVSDFEDLEFVGKLPVMILDFFNRHSRLEGRDHTVAVQVLNLILSSQSISKKALMDTFEVNSDKLIFLLNYGTLLIRQCLLELKDELAECRFLQHLSWRPVDALIDLFAPHLTD